MPHHVVIIGGGFGGLRAAQALDGSAVDIVLVDRRNYHLFQPLLYQVATSILTPSHIASPLRQVFRRQRNVTVAQAEVVGVDASRQEVLLKGDDPPLAYDYLVLATGAETSYFGHDDFAQYAPSLKSLANAEALRNRILGAFEACEKKVHPAEHPELLTFVLVGGGPTGVEMSGAIAELARNTLTSEFRRYDPRSLRVVLVEAGPRILSMFEEKLSRKAHEHLEKLGVEIRTGTRVEHVDAEGVIVNGERLRSRNVFWTAGVKASPVADWLGIETDHTRRVKVLPDCSVPETPEVFVIGDAASHEVHGSPLPGVAQVALQQGAYVGALIEGRLAKRPAPPPFHYRDKGTLAAVGRGYAVLQGMGMRTAGLFASFVWAFIHIEFLALAANRVRTVFIWLWTAITRRRLDCLIVEPAALPKASHVEARGS